MADIAEVHRYTHRSLHLVRHRTFHMIDGCRYYICNYRLVISVIQSQPFSEPVGPTVTMPDSPLEIFSLLFTPSIVDHIVCETNRYAQQCLAGTDQRRDQSLPWILHPHGNCARTRSTGLLVTVRSAALQSHSQQDQ